MRLCGHDCVVRSRYDPGSAGSGRYFYRLDPQDPLNFGRNLLSLLYTLASGRSPLAGVRFCGWHTFGTPTARIGNARVRPIVYLTTSVRDHLTHWHKGGRQGGGLGSTLGSSKRGNRNATGQPFWIRQPLTRSGRHHTNRSQSAHWHTPTQNLRRQGLPFTTSGHETRNATGSLSSDQSLDIDSLCQVHSQPFTHHNMLSRVLSRLSLNLAERAVLRYIRQNPGHQLFMINDATLRSHHSWGTKSVLSDLERHGKIYVRRFRPVRVKGDITVKKIKPLYYAADRYHG